MANSALVLRCRACAPRGVPDAPRQYTLQGQVLSVAADRREANIKHEEITGFMPAMTMPYKASDARQFEHLAAGDLITATLVVVSNDAYLKDVKKVGEAPIEKAPQAAPSASSGFELLKPWRSRAERPVRRSGRQDTRPRVVPGLDAGRDVHLHALPDTDVLPAHGPALRGDSEQAQDRTGVAARPARERQLRSDRRHATGAQRHMPRRSAPIRSTGRF